MTTSIGADVRLEDEASVVLFQPLTPAAHDWFKENVQRKIGNGKVAG